METFRHITGFVKKSIPRLALGFVVLLVVDLIQLVIPIITKNAIDKIQAQEILKSGLALIGLQILGLTVGIMIMRFFWRILIIGNSFIIERLIRHKFYEHLMSLSQNFFNHNKIGDLMAHATNDLNAVRMMFGFGMIAGFDILLMAIASLAFMVSINLKLTLFAIIPLPIISLTIEKSSVEYVQKNISMALLDGIFHPMMGLIISFSMLITLVLGGQLAINGVITIGDFYAFNSYLGMLIWPMIAIGWIVNLYQRGTASLKRINKIFDSNPDVTDELADHNITDIKGAIKIKNLNYLYPETKTTIFNKVSTEIEQGKTLAIVGKTGCGKTTLIDLLTRIYNPPQGAIFIDGNDVHKIPIKTLHRNIVMVPQDIFLFSDTIANNIALGRPDATREEIEQASKMAQVHEDILEFENSYETVVGERGVTLSGGQKQRVAIARALLCDPSILILDDALSAVDTLTEKNILNHLIKERKSKTTIIISHRISSVSHADKIIVIEDGNIIESGSHKDLIELDGVYKDLDNKQKIEERLEGEF